MKDRDLSVLDSREQRIKQSIDWALGDKCIRNEYKGKVVAVFGKQVCGSGETQLDALQDAKLKADCPDINFIALVVIP